MDFARVLLLPVLLIAGLVDVASAQQSTWHVFPQFAFGGGWESTLMVQAGDTPTSCEFGVPGYPAMRDSSGNVFSRTNNSISLSLPSGEWAILRTETPQGEATTGGLAWLDCTAAVSANVLFSLEAGGAVVGEAVVEPAREIVGGRAEAQFLSDHRDGARYGVAVANPLDQTIAASVRVEDSEGREIAGTTVIVRPWGNQVFLLDELVPIPAGHTGRVLIGTDQGQSVYVIALRFTGPVFTTIPVTTTPEPGLVDVASAQQSTWHVFPQFAFGGGWESTLMVQAGDTPTSCEFGVPGYPAMRDSSGNVFSRTNNSISLSLPSGEWAILRTETPQGEATTGGLAWLDCTAAVSANVLFSLEAGGAVVGEAVVEPAREIVGGRAEAQFLSDHRDGARYGVAVANPLDQTIAASVRVEDSEGREIAGTTVIVRPWGNQAFLLDELVPIPAGHTGRVLIGTDQGQSVYVIALRFTGPVFTTIPVTPPPPPDLQVTAFSVSDTNPVAFSMLTLSATVRNNSDSAIVDVLVRYSFDRAGYGTETPATTRLAVLAASESIDDSVVVRVPSPGTYKFRVWVTDHSPSTTGHSSKWITVTVAEPEPDPDPDPEPACCPDLVVTKFSVSDTNPIAGSTLTLSAAVRNIGTGASGGAILEYSIRAGAGELAARTLLAGLAASESIDDSVVVRVPSPGTYEYFACVRESTAPSSTDNCSRSIVVTVEQQTPDDPSIDPRFDDAFWQEFVFGQKDEPFTLDHQVIQVLNTTSPNVYIYTGFGHQAIPDEHRDIIREAIPSAAEQLTGQRYSGRIESGTEHLVERLGWITVRYFTDADQHGSCGFTRVGEDPNSIFLNHDCMKRRGPDAIAYLKHVFVHEFGHTMGFKHVLDANAIMGSGNLSDTFSAREQFHAQLAYKVGRGARYCGWPLGAACLSSADGARRAGRPVVPRMVID